MRFCILIFVRGGRVTNSAVLDKATASVSSFRLTETLTDDKRQINYSQDERAQNFELSVALSSEVYVRPRRTSAPPKMADSARLRLRDLQRMIGSGYTDEDGVQAALSEPAIDTALEITRQLEARSPSLRVAFFPLLDGGVRLQAVGAQLTVSLVVMPDGVGMFGQYASSSAYHREEFNGPVTAATFLATSVR